MDKITKHIICELTGYSPSTISVSQGDRMAREISCRLLENGVPWLVPEGARVVAAYTLPDGTRGSYDAMPDGSPAWAVAGNIITVALIDPLTMLPGATELSIVLLGGEGQQLAVWPIRLTVVGDKKVTVPENLPPLGAGYDGRILYGGPGGLLTPLGLGDGVRVERRDDGSLWLVAVGGGSGSGGGISQETDPTVSDWAKQPNKPSYTAQEVGALPVGTKIPANTSDLSNDSGFITRAVTDLQNYYTQAQTRELLAQIPRFRVTVVQQLPDTGEELVLYLVPFADAQGQYLEYIWVDGRWEVIGSQQVDLAGYATEDWVREGYQPKGNYLTSAPVSSVNGETGAVQLTAEDVGAMSASEANGIIANLLDEAKKSGDFDGDPGRGIQSIVRTAGNGAAGSVDTYTITYTDGTTGTYQVRNGANGTNGADGKDGTDGDPGADGRGIKSIARTSGNGAAGTVDTYTITYTDGTTSTYQVRNGANGTNGADGVDGDDGITPHIGDNGNWYLGDTDTGVTATGPQGPAYTLTDADKQSITAAVVAALPQYAGEVEVV